MNTTTSPRLPRTSSSVNMRPSVAGSEKAGAATPSSPAGDSVAIVCSWKAATREDAALFREDTLCRAHCRIFVRARQVAAHGADRRGIVVRAEYRRGRDEHVGARARDLRDVPLLHAPVHFDQQPPSPALPHGSDFLT